MLTGFWFWIGIAAVAAVLIYALLRRRRAPRLVAERTYVQGSAADPARALFETAGGEPPTEDAIAQARLGGSRGASALKPAPMVRQQRENTPRHIDDGHVA